MKNKETIVGWVLIIALMIGFVFYQNKKFESDQKLKKEQAKAQQIEKAKEKMTRSKVNERFPIQNFRFFCF